MAAPALLGGLSPAAFLARHWQQGPLLVRGAWPDFRDPLSPEELAGLACEDAVSSRLVRGAHGRLPWELRYGPFDDDDFLSLPEDDWTLLVQDVEKHVPELDALLQPFRFLPDWRIDDLMISYAATGGGVGPHWDAYDVFLLQGAGRRRWQIDTRPAAPDNLLPDNELRLLREFDVEQEWVLEPGDMLYLPPGVAHHGVALEPCLTYSIGFRAPTQRELAAAFCDRLIERLPPERRYRDPRPLAVATSPGRIDAAALDALLALLREALSWEPEAAAGWCGRFLTEAEPELLPPRRRPALDRAGLRHLLTREPDAVWRRAAGLRFAYFAHDDGGAVWLFAAGERWALPARPAMRTLARLLCDRRDWRGAELAGVADDADAAAVLLALCNLGFLDNDDDNNDNDTSEEGCDDDDDDAD